MPEQRANTFAEKLTHLPALPGVYLMKDRMGVVLYVGKAKNLKHRVRSYFHRPQEQRYKTHVLVSKIADLETIVTNTEKDALILENNLIKKYRPRFNVNLRDDKNYPYLRLSLDEPYPCLTIARQARRDGAQYFGPFASAAAVRETLKLINQIFPLRKCRGKCREKKRPCIYYQLGQCPAPCCGRAEENQYRESVRDVQLFLQGRGREIIASLRKRMELESQALRFEQAARIRDRINALAETLERQTVISLDFADRDVFAWHREEDQMEMVVLFVRCGRLSGSRSYTLHNLSMTDEEALASFLTQFYDTGKFIPQEIIIPIPLPDKELVQDWLHEISGRTVPIVTVTQGPRYELLKMAQQNARLLFTRKPAAAQPDHHTLLALLQKKLSLKNFPASIECVDVSNISGASAVGATVRFEQGEPHRESYRRFRIKTVQQADDYAMMYEVLMRHLSRLQAEQRMPDLLMVDGGKGQLSVLLRALQDAGIQTVDAIALAKGRATARNIPEDKLFVPHRKHPLLLGPRSAILLFLQRIRDEAHRCAVAYHQQLKGAQDLRSPLVGIKGIGKITARRVLQHFGSLEHLQAATQQQLAMLSFLNKNQAERIYQFFHAQQPPAPSQKSSPNI